MTGGRFEMMMPEDVARELNEKLDSHDWWFVIGGGRSDSVLPVIESRYYTPGTDANALFEVLMSHYGISVVTAHKSRMTAQQLADCLREAGADLDLDALERRLEKEDVLFVGEDEAIAASQAVFALMLSGEK